MTKIKICGLMRDCDCDYLNEAMPDYAGFIFVKGRRRCISPETAARFRDKLDAKIKTVGVFLDEDADEVCRIAATGIINAVQLHGKETDDYIAQVKERTGLTVIKAFTVRGIADVNTALHTSADLLLMDNGAGTGRMFDHELLEEADRLFFLAGGLDPNNVGAVVSRYSPYGVDVSTGVETDGNKDRDKIIRFVNEVRKANTF